MATLKSVDGNLIAMEAQFVAAAVDEFGFDGTLSPRSLEPNIINTVSTD